ncbi:DUF6509 family protein [Bacillus songklensis]|uniref:DUF6509 family protein n=1 Tax=Bacillus songklensis TaxID=1069116 RepID=A0ABV8B3S3_9BACI
MLTILGHTVELLDDPFGILSGNRYEFFLNIAVPEDDELHTENELGIKVIYVVDEQGSHINQYHVFERNEKGEEKYIDIWLDEEEEEIIAAYCKENLPSE